MGKFDEFLKEIKATRSLYTYKSYVCALREFPQGGTRGEILEYIVESPNSSQTKKQKLTILKTALDWDGRLKDTTRRLIERFKANRPVQACPTEEEFEKLWDSLDFYLDKAALALMAYNGLRRQELIALNKSDVLPDSRLLLRDTKGKRDVIVPIVSERVKEALKIYIKKERPSTKSRALFVSAVTRERFSVDGFHVHWRHLLNAAGLRQYHIHSFRRFFANQLDRAGVPITTIRAAMRHTSISTTMRYINTDDDAVKEAMDRTFNKQDNSENPENPENSENLENS